MNTNLLQKAMERFIKDSEYSKATVKSYRIAFKYYLVYLDEHQIVKAKTSDVIQYREQLRERGYSTHYIYIHMSALKALYRYLRIHYQRLGLEENDVYDIMTPIKNEKIKNRIHKRVLTLSQAKQLILKTRENRHYVWQYRDHAMVFLMITSGVRSIEVIHALREDLKLKEGQLVLYINKPGKKRYEEYIKISNGVKVALEEYLNLRDDDNPYLFISHKQVSPELHLSRTFFRHMFRTLLKDAGFDNREFTPHSLRHTTATLNLIRGASLEQTKSLLRHTSIESTKIYEERIKRLNDDTEREIEEYILREEPFVFAQGTNLIILE